MVGLPPGMIITDFRRNLHAGRGERAPHHRLARRQQPVGRRVAVMPVAQRLDGGLDDMLRRLEVGLADAEIDDVLALLLQGGGACKDGKGIFFAETVEGGYRLEHFSSPSGANTGCAFL